jgi:hypothetical protein
MAIAENRKRDFIAQMLQMIANNRDKLTEAGYNPENAYRELLEQYQKATLDAGKKAETLAAYKDAVKISGESLRIAYVNASRLAEILSGLLGKKNNMVLEMRKIRKE